MEEKDQHRLSNLIAWIKSENDEKTRQAVEELLRLAELGMAYEKLCPEGHDLWCETCVARKMLERATYNTWGKRGIGGPS